MARATCRTPFRWSGRSSPYQLPDALGDLYGDDQRAQHRPAVGVVGDAVGDLAGHSTGPEGRGRRVARFSQTLNKRDAQLRALLANANKATTVLAQRTDQVVA